MNIYPFAGEIKMIKAIKDGQEVVEWQRVDLTYHADGNVGIGTPPDASAPLVMGEPVERIRFIMSNQEPEAHVFAHPTTDWARVDKDLNVTHLDMELCAKGPQNVYTALALAIWNKAIAQEREACAKVCEDIPLPKDSEALTHLPTIERCAAAIRARGEAEYGRGEG
jgi:hypothetical protein